MTREEAIERIRDHMIVHAMNEPRAIYISEALSMAINALEQERSRLAQITQYRNDCEKLMQENEQLKKALKQEPILDEMFENIKTEIDFIPTYGAKFADGSINVHVNKKDVLQIIDKYRGD